MRLFAVLLLLSFHNALVAQPGNTARQSRILFMRDGQLWAVTPDGTETIGPFPLVEPVSSVAASPDGRYLACVTAVEGALHIYGVSPDAELDWVERLEPGSVYIDAVVWSPDGRYLAVMTSPLPRSPTIGGTPAIRPEYTSGDRLLGITDYAKAAWPLHVLPWHGDGERPSEENGEGVGLSQAVLSVPHAVGASWAPDSAAIRFGEAQPAGPGRMLPERRDFTIRMADVATGETTEIVPWELANLWEATLSPDGARLASLTDSGKGILIVPCAGNAPAEQLATREDGHIHRLRWSPDGTRLAFTRSWGEPTPAGRPKALCVCDLESGQEDNLTNTELRVETETISWSPDGALIAFCGANADLYVADPVSGAITLVEEGCESWPARAGAGLGGSGRRPIPWLPPVHAAEGEGGGDEKTTDAD